MPAWTDAEIEKFITQNYFNIRKAITEIVEFMIAENDFEQEGDLYREVMYEHIKYPWE